jgi:hypothetical protein
MSRTAKGERESRRIFLTLHRRAAGYLPNRRTLRRAGLLGGVAVVAVSVGVCSGIDAYPRGKAATSIRGAIRTIRNALPMREAEEKAAQLAAKKAAAADSLVDAVKTAAQLMELSEKASYESRSIGSSVHLVNFRATSIIDSIPLKRKKQRELRRCGRVSAALLSYCWWGFYEKSVGR